MRYRFFSLLLLSAGFLIFAFHLQISAQTATTGAIVGTVTDKSGAVLTNAEVELSNSATSQVTKATTNNDGNYIFPSVPPGQYNISVTKSGFRKTTLTNFKVEVTRSYPLNFELEVGDVQQSVEITASAGVEMQTTDSTIGNVISGKTLPLMPALTRQANELIRVQPASGPGGDVAGSRPDQSTFTLDGIDVTNNSVGGINTYMQLPIDAVEEFRVAIANPNASFGRGAGGQVAVISKRGSTQYHGSAFWYHQNDNLNAATWTNKRTIAQTVTDPVRRAKLQDPELKDNRFGGNFSGPLLPWSDKWREKLFYFAQYEGRRFPRNTEFLRIVPSDTLKQGILRFRDSSGNVVSYNLATSSLCGATGTLACDPRGLGLNPSISSLWSKLPAGNDPAAAGADGFNTTGYRGNVNNSLSNNYYNFRIDYNITERWKYDAAIRYFGQANAGSTLLSIIGGNAESRENLPNRQNMIKTGMTGQITNNLTGEFGFGWVRSRTATDRFRPNQSAELLAIPGTNTSAGPIALDIGALGGTQSLLSEPIDVGTQVARKQANDNKNFQWNADLNWVKGNHTFQFGSHLRYLPTFHLRDDKVVGSLGALVAQIDSDLGNVTIPAAVRPPTCGAITANCVVAADVRQWNRLYAGTLGIIDNINVLAVRDAQFKPLPFGETLVSDTTLWSPEFYFQDVWRIRPSLTLTYGVNYGWQTPPTEKLGRSTVQVDGRTLEVQTAREYLSLREAVARDGGIFNPPIAFLPVNDAKRPVFDTDWNNLGPRIAVAWNPNYQTGLFGKVFGDRKTVIRGGYGLIYDRQNTVQSVIVPSLGVAFGQTINVSAPACNATGAGGSGCLASSSNPALRGFRVGVDGSLPLPVVPTQTIPVSPPWGFIRPGVAAPTPNDVVLFPEILSFQVDPSIEVAENHAFDLTWQRELPGNMLLEAGYLGRYASKLTQSMSFGQAPYNHVDRASGQTFAQAFDAVARALRPGGSGTPAPQPWFENQVPGGLAAIQASQSSNFINGNVNGVFLALDRLRIFNGLQPFNNYMAQTLFLRASTGRSNYNALFLTLRKRLSRGTQFTVNYTFSRSLDQLGAIQNAASVMPNSFDLDAEYGPSPFDLTHLFNATYVYELPFGRGRYFGTSSGLLNKIIGGWYTSGIFTAASGDALTVNQGPGVWGGSLFLGFNSGAIPTVDPNSFGNSVNSNVSGSGGVGTTSNAAASSRLNLFENPEQVFNNFRRVEISRDGRAGRANPLRGLPRWNLDISIGKKTQITESTNITFLADFFNVLNKVDFTNPSLDLNDRVNFGVITSQFTPPSRTVGSRWIQFGLRIDF
ncbi:MAG: carboxypeptidase-like regulatory domain-containing protein [Acidobacteria bacterium]|nr:carboxypeptidase-like regulatory domain-containing protein [Acidobacteriota bacterium]